MFHDCMFLYSVLTPSLIIFLKIRLYFVVRKRGNLFTLFKGHTTSKITFKWEEGSDLSDGFIIFHHCSLCSLSGAYLLYHLCVFFFCFHNYNHLLLCSLEVTKAWIQNLYKFYHFNRASVWRTLSMKFG